MFSLQLDFNKYMNFVLGLAFTCVLFEGLTICYIFSTIMNIMDQNTVYRYIFTWIKFHEIRIKDLSQEFNFYKFRKPRIPPTCQFLNFWNWASRSRDIEAFVRQPHTLEKQFSWLEMDILTTQFTLVCHTSV